MRVRARDCFRFFTVVKELFVSFFKVKLPPHQKNYLAIQKIQMFIAKTKNNQWVSQWMSQIKQNSMYMYALKTLNEIVSLK